jgi:hypothetical protein
MDGGGLSIKNGCCSASFAVILFDGSYSNKRFNKSNALVLFSNNVKLSAGAGGNLGILSI